MRLRIALDGRARDVDVDGEPPDVRVSVDGKEVPVRLEVEGSRTTARIEGRTIVLEFGGGLKIDGAPRNARVEWLADDAAKEGASGPVDVRPPMPGRVVRILVKPGDTIRRGAPLLVLEAMKMQNEIPAPVAGTVLEVRVHEGDAVTANDVVLRVDRRAS
jgi:biotin carboxyl carrier protein